MRKLIWKILLMSLGISILGVVQDLHAQEVMNINKKDNTTISIPVSDIQSITFSGNAPVATGNTVSDIDGNVYPVVKIGHQVWMAENLRTTKYNDGTSIKLVSDYDLWKVEMAGAYCYYMNNSDNKIPFGGLYNYAAVNTGKLCPEGWHVPVVEEWNALRDEIKDNTGGALKGKGPEYWTKTQESITNETGFTALPAGYRNYMSKYINFGSQAVWWSATEIDEAKAYSAVLNDYNSKLNTLFSEKKNAKSIRCIRN